MHTCYFFKNSNIIINPNINAFLLNKNNTNIIINANINIFINAILMRFIHT